MISFIKRISVLFLIVPVKLLFAQETQHPIISGIVRGFVDDGKNEEMQFEITVFAQNINIGLVDSLHLTGAYWDKWILPTAIQTINGTTKQLKYTSKIEFFSGGIYVFLFKLPFVNETGTKDTLKLEYIFGLKELGDEGYFSSPYFHPTLIHHHPAQPLYLNLFNFQPTFNLLDTVLYDYSLRFNPDTLPLSLIKETGGTSIPLNTIATNSTHSFTLRTRCRTQSNRYRADFDLPIVIIPDTNMVGWFDFDPAYKNRSGFIVTSPQDSELTFSFTHPQADSIELSFHTPLLNFGGNVKATVEQVDSSFIIFSSWQAPLSIQNRLPIDINWLVYAYIRDVRTGPYYFNFTLTNNVEVGIESPNIIQPITQVYPNPSSGILHLSHQTTIFSIDVFSATGKLSKHIQLDQPNTETTITLDELPSGLYFINVNGFKQQAIKWILVRE